jgi:DNA-binding NtrC family response regulator
MALTFGYVQKDELAAPARAGDFILCGDLTSARRQSSLTHDEALNPWDDDHQHRHDQDVRLMGRLSGWDVARRMRKADPTFPVIYMTGAAADQWASQGVPGSILLEKPFAPAQLIAAISQLLNIGSPPTALG